MKNSQDFEKEYQMIPVLKGKKRAKIHTWKFLNGIMHPNWIEKGNDPHPQGPASIREIYEYLQITLKHCVGMHALCNYLSKDPNIVNVGSVKHEGYLISNWASREWVQEKWFGLYSELWDNKTKVVLIHEDLLVPKDSRLHNLFLTRGVLKGTYEEPPNQMFEHRIFCYEGLEDHLYSDDL